MSIIRTTLLLGALTGLLLGIGYLLGGANGMTFALVFAVILNFGAYWFSDKIVLAMYKAQPSGNEKLNNTVAELAKKAGLPKPKVYIVPVHTPNAFATGRSPKHAVIAATQGLLDNLNDEEVEGVLAHELAHVKNRDTLISAMSATIAGAISYLGQMAWFSLFWGDRRNGNAVLLPLIILAPIGAVIIQLAISRGREFGADYTGAMISKKPLSLASALEKISLIAKRYPLRGNSATSHLWIVNPFKADGFTKLFSTHPPVEERVKKLREMAKY